MNLKINSINKAFFEVGGDNDIRVNGADGTTISRNDVVAGGRLALCEYIGSELDKRPDMKGSFVSRLNGIAYSDFARKVTDSGGVYVVPAFTGLGAPNWDMHARGTVLGLTAGTGKNHIIRAALEAIAYETEDVIAAMNADIAAIGDEITLRPISVLRVDGGASANDLLMQMQSDLSGLSVVRSANPEATALGAAFLAGLGVGFYRDRDELRACVSEGKSFSPEMPPELRAVRLRGWHRAVAACRAFAAEEE